MHRGKLCKAELGSFVQFNNKRKLCREGTKQKRMKSKIVFDT